MKFYILRTTAAALILGYLAGGSINAAESVIIAPSSPQISPSLQASPRGLKRKVAIARFTNETNYGRSFLVDQNSNPIGKQALDILSKKLLDTEKFILLERADLEKINAELGLTSVAPLKNGADYLIVGSITAFGRKTEGEVGVFTRKKRQTAFAKLIPVLHEPGVSLTLFFRREKIRGSQPLANREASVRPGGVLLRLAMPTAPKLPRLQMLHVASPKDQRGDCSGRLPTCRTVAGATHWVCRR